jgi:SAM-dependent methyltransferase
MKLEDILHRTIPPEPWDEGDKIPWDDPEFSRRMLREHLSQAHDLASRRAHVIDRHVDWIHGDLLRERPSRVLDLGCGPGLYTSRLTVLGHECAGIDFSPAAIEYARHQASSSRLRCRYEQGDLRNVDFGTGYDLVMLIFGEFNMFRREDALKILSKARRALEPAGQLVLETHTFEFVEVMGRANAFWTTSERGLFSEQPHLILSESFWNADRMIATHRTFVIHMDDGTVDRYVETAQAYTFESYAAVLAEAGLILERSLLALPGSPTSDEMVVLVARPT